MLETGLVLGMTATHVGVPFADFVAWAVMLALLVAPVQLDDRRRQRLVDAAARNTADSREVEARPAATPAISRPSREPIAVMPAATRLSAAEQWQAVSRLVSAGTERALSIARDQQTIRRELDSLDFSLENLRRELSAVMTLPVIASSAQFVPVRVASRPQALAA